MSVVDKMWNAASLPMNAIEKAWSTKMSTSDKSLKSASTNAVDKSWAPNPLAAAFVPRKADDRKVADSKVGSLHRVTPQPQAKKRVNRSRTTSGQPKQKPEKAPEVKEAKEEPKPKEPAQRYQIYVPDCPGDLTDEPVDLKPSRGGQKHLKKVTWFPEEAETGTASVVTDDPAFNRDLKRGERFATIPPTANEKEEHDMLRQLLDSTAHLWEDDDFLLEHAIDRHRLAQATSVRPLPAGINPLEVGTYRGLFTLPWVMQVHRDFPDDAMRAKLALARATCLRGISDENIDPEKGDVPLCLVNWGLLQDPNAAKRRQKEKQEEEKWQEDTREVWMHQVVAEGIYEQKSKALYPLEFGSPDKSVSEALDQLDYQTFVYRTQSHAQKEPDVSLGSASTSGPQVIRGPPSRPKLRPIIKTNHLADPPSPSCSPAISLASPPPPEPPIAPQNSVCPVRPSFRVKPSARNLRPAALK